MLILNYYMKLLEQQKLELSFGHLFFLKFILWNSDGGIHFDGKSEKGFSFHIKSYLRRHHLGSEQLVLRQKRLEVLITSFHFLALLAITRHFLFLSTLSGFVGNLHFKINFYLVFKWSVFQTVRSKSAAIWYCFWEHLALWSNLSMEV